MVECLRLRGCGSSLTRGTALCPRARHFILCFVLVQSKKTLLDMTENMLLGCVESNQTNKHTHISLMSILRDISKQCRMQRLIRFCTVCKQNVLLLTFEKSTKNRNGRVQLIRVRNSTWPNGDRNIKSKSIGN